MTTKSAASTGSESELTPEVKRAVSVLILGGIATMLDTTIVTIALRTLVIELHSTVGMIQWVSTSYLLALAIAIPMTGWVEAWLGGKRAWMTALAIFGIGSALCAVAWNDTSLIGFRVLQGLGAGLIFPLMQTLTVRAAGGRASSSLIATVSLPLSLGPIFGPVLGGVILNWLSWRWMFLVNVPVILVGALLAQRFLPPDQASDGKPRRRLDLFGLVLLAGALTGILLGLSNLSRHGEIIQSGVLVPLLTGLAALGLFVAWALQPRNREPIVDIRLLRLRSLGSASSVLFTAGAAMYSGLFLLPLYYQTLRDVSVLAAALLLIPQGVGSLAARFVIGGLVAHFGARRVTIVSFLLIAATTVPFAFAGAGTGLWWLGAALLARGFGLGTMLIPSISVAYNDVESADIPHATMTTRISQQVGASFGIAVVAVVLQSLLSQSAARAFHTAFWWAIGISLVACIPAIALPAARKPQTPAVAGPVTAGAAPKD